MFSILEFFDRCETREQQLHPNGTKDFLQSSVLEKHMHWTTFFSIFHKPLSRDMDSLHMMEM